jgi:hypothetical protein
MDNKLWESWLGKMQIEFGVLSTSNMLLELQVASIQEENKHHLELIDALKERVLLAEKANQELKEMIQPKRKK